jgi:hypothetical protein
MDAVRLCSMKLPADFPRKFPWAKYFAGRKVKNEKRQAAERAVHSLLGIYERP